MNNQRRHDGSSSQRGKKQKSPVQAPCSSDTGQITTASSGTAQETGTSSAHQLPSQHRSEAPRSTSSDTAITPPTQHEHAAAESTSSSPGARRHSSTARGDRLLSADLSEFAKVQQALQEGSTSDSEVASMRTNTEFERIGHSDVAEHDVVIAAAGAAAEAVEDATWVRDIPEDVPEADTAGSGVRPAMGRSRDDSDGS
ncbi:hypothetical protein BAUCODRAFT_400352 [Baudoinia panamericana UAMH 10762]|uniref:Uncharacterized protein n=1 Tax=Baudoinia panamericana (strain UAMH 10762) TaxID=717646 RepID=M2N5P9_BAUPA|nr:uncharacterized protein BAUCODRAFT_400352 [Baudoinia panamericana UAMH 10762]EMC99358.1 hypothetical protein BAUCODRAFT_400352 [Baudoinia panamericana UAMH 10762]